jgi:hypothetical protein
MVDYGYGDGAPDVANTYGYGDGAPDVANTYGYGDGGAPSGSNDYGCGDGAPSTNNNNAVDYGYGDAQPDYGYGDATPDGANDEQAKPRTRRRNSVTRYSLVCQDQVVNEFNAHANVIDQFRNGGGASTGPPPATSSVPLNDTHGDASPNLRNRAQSTDSSDGPDGGKKKKRGWGLFGRSQTN